MDKVSPPAFEPLDDTSLDAPATATQGTAPERTAVSETNEVVREEAGEDTFVDAWHRALSGTITGPANWVDNFFYDERFESEENQSRLLLRMESFSEDGLGTDIKIRTSLRIAIPYMNKKWKLIVAGEPDEEPVFEKTPGVALQQSIKRIDDNDVSVSLQQSIVETYRRYISTRLGFIIRDWEPEVYLEGRYRAFYKLDPWGVRFTERLRWYTYKGWESIATLDFERALSERLFFRTTAEGDWFGEQNGFPHSLTFALSRIFSPRRAIEYSWSNSFQTRPNYSLEEIALAARYRQRIWRDWFFVDIEPQLRFSRSENFDIVPGIMLRMEVVIGQYNRLR